MEKNIYKEAILDAKAVRASAIANAKAALQETIEPKIQEMMRLKLSEELEEELDEEVEEENISEEVEEGAQEEGITESSLDEILAELEAMEEGYGKEEESVKEEVKEEVEEESINEEAEEGEMEEAKKPKAAEEEEEESEEEGEEEESGKATEEEPVDDETKVIDITLGDLKQVLQSVMAQGTESEAGMGDLEANVPDEVKGDEATDDSISLDEILAELEEEGYEEEGYAAGHQTDAAGAGEIEEAKKSETEKELEEAKATIQTLRESMNEINLLNAKLLYMNKIFKSKNLTESQKIKVIKAFDRANSVNEVKNTYETLKESVGAKKEMVKESIGFASKPIGNAPSTPIVESDNFVSRWQKIAGIK